MHEFVQARRHKSSGYGDFEAQPFQERRARFDLNSAPFGYPMQKVSLIGTGYGFIAQGLLMNIDQGYFGAPYDLRLIVLREVGSKQDRYVRECWYIIFEETGDK